MTIKRAREILGADATNLTDADIENLITLLERLAKIEYEEFIKPQLSKRS